MIKNFRVWYQSEKILLVIIFLIAFLWRLIYLIQIEKYPMFYHLAVDTRLFHEWAVRIAAGDWIGDRIFNMSPLYPYLLAICFKFISNDLFFVRLLQIGVGSLSCVLVSAITRKVFNEKTAPVIAGVIAAVYGPFIFYDGMIMKTFLALFWTLSLTWFLCISSEKRFFYPFLAGVSLALGALARENLILLIPVLGIWLLWENKSPILFKRMRGVIGFLLGIVLVLAPVTLRNYFVGDEFVLITTVGGENFYLGNNPEADGYYRPPKFINPHPFLEHENWRRKASEIQGREMTEKESSEYWFSRGKEFVVENPLQFLKLEVRKLLLFWNFYEVQDNYNYYFWGDMISPLLGGSVLHFGLIAPFGLVGFILALGRARDCMVLYIMLLGYIFSFLLFFDLARYRLPAVPFVIIFASYCMSRTIVWIRGRSWKPLALLLPATLLLFYLCNSHMAGIGHLGKDCDECYAKVGMAYANQGNYNESIRWYKEAVQLRSDFEITRNGLGMAYQGQNRLAQAEQEFKAALQIQPKMGEAYYNLGTVYMSQKRLNEAISTFQMALQHTFVPDFLTSIHNNLGNAYANKGLNREAMKEYKKALTIDPSHSNSQRNLEVVFKRL